MWPKWVQKAPRNLTANALLQDCRNQCPELFPKVKGKVTFIDVIISQEETPIDAIIFGDWEVAMYAQQFKPQVQGLISSYELMKNSVLQIQLKTNSLDFFILNEYLYEGQVKSLLKGFAIVESENMRLAVRTHLNSSVNSSCTLMRDPYLHFINEHLDYPSANQPSSSMSIPVISGWRKPGDVLSSQPKVQGQATCSLASPQSKYSLSLPQMNAPQASISPTTFYTDLLPVEIDLDQNLDVSSIDVESFPEIIDEKRLPIRSLANSPRWNQEQTASILSLTRQYTHWRRSRGEGNCYYLAVAIGYLEHLCRLSTPPQELYQFYLGLFKQETVLLHDSLLGFFRYFLIRLKKLYNSKRCGDALLSLQILFQDRKFVLAAVATFRMLARKELNNKWIYGELVPYLLDSAVEQVLENMARMGEEAEGITFLAMASALDAKIVHISINDTTCREDVFEPLTPGRKLVLHVLLKHGRYSVLYPIAAQKLDRYSYRTNQFNEEPWEVWLAEGLFEEVQAKR